MRICHLRIEYMHVLKSLFSVLGHGQLQSELARRVREEIIGKGREMKRSMSGITFRHVHDHFYFFLMIHHFDGELSLHQCDTQLELFFIVLICRPCLPVYKSIDVLYNS